MSFYLEEYKVKAIESAIEANLPVLLVGETGVGKTTIIKELAKNKKQKLIRISINEQVGREDLIGKYLLVEGSTKWVDGPLLTAIKKGEWIVLDEINSARPEVLFTLHAILDDEKAIILNDKENEKVVCHKNFRLFCTMNPPTYRGVKSLNQALTSRFVIVSIDVMPQEKEFNILQEYHKNKDIDDTLVSIASSLRNSQKAGEIEYFCSTRDLIQAAQLVEKGNSLEASVCVAIINKMSESDKDSLNNETVAKFIEKIPRIDIESQLKTLSEKLATFEQKQNESEKLDTTLVEKKNELTEITHKIENSKKELQEIEALKLDPSYRNDIIKGYLEALKSGI